MITSLALSMAYQICEAFLIGSLLSQLFLTLYLLQRAVMQRLSFPTATIQANLAIKALLKSLVCRNPRPPFFLTWHKWSHDFQAKYLLDSFFGFHQNLPVIESNFSLVLSGISKVDKVYVGRAWATDLIIVLRPAQDRHLLRQPNSLAFSLSWRNLKSFVLFLVVKRGAPKQNTSFGKGFICNTCFNILCFTLGAIFEKKILQTCFYLWVA